MLEVRGDPPPEFAPLDGWAQFIRQVLRSGRISFLATQFTKRRFELAPGDLPALGLQLLEEWDDTSLPADEEDARVAEPRQSSTPGQWLESLQEAHAAHARFEGSTASASAAKPQLVAPSQRLKPGSAEIREKLELLDDLVFGAIGGKRVALEELRKLWPEVRGALGDDMRADSREQYLRHALSLWENGIDSDGVRDPASAMQALDVLCVLFDDT